LTRRGLLVYHTVMTGRALARLRRRLNLTQSELAELLGVALITLKFYEGGQRKVTPAVESRVRFIEAAQDGAFGDDLLRDRESAFVRELRARPKPWDPVYRGIVGAATERVTRLARIDAEAKARGGLTEAEIHDAASHMHADWKGLSLVLRAWSEWQAKRDEWAQAWGRPPKGKRR
jgi:transcriptional regulator with XRE-family HTH domain